MTTTHTQSGSNINDIQQVKSKLAGDVAAAKTKNAELDQKLKDLLSRKSSVMDKFPDPEAVAAGAHNSEGETESEAHEADVFIKDLLEDLDTELNDHILNLATKDAR